MSNPSPRFTGIFIPAEILERQDLTFFEMLLLSWIDALYCPKHGGCYASNEYLGTKIKNSQPNTVAKAITNLRALGLIEDVSFDGRTRIIRALINRLVDKVQSKQGLDRNPIGVGQASNSKMDRHPSGVPLYPYIESKDDRKEERRRESADKSATPASSPSKKKDKQPEPAKIAYGAHVLLKANEYETLCTEMGKEMADYYIQAINLYVPNNGPYKDYAATVRSWHLRDKSKGSLPSSQNIRQASNPSQDAIVQNRRVCEAAEATLEHLFTTYVYFQASPDRAILINKSKDFKVEYIYEKFDKKTLKEALLKDLAMAFPGARELLMGQATNKSIKNLVADLATKFKPTEAAT